MMLAFISTTINTLMTTMIAIPEVFLIELDWKTSDQKRHHHRHGGLQQYHSLEIFETESERLHNKWYFCLDKRSPFQLCCDTAEPALDCRELPPAQLSIILPLGKRHRRLFQGFSDRDNEAAAAAPLPAQVSDYHAKLPALHCSQLYQSAVQRTWSKFTAVNSVEVNCTVSKTFIKPTVLN